MAQKWNTTSKLSYRKVDFRNFIFHVSSFTNSHLQIHQWFVNASFLNLISEHLTAHMASELSLTPYHSQSWELTVSYLEDFKLSNPISFNMHINRFCFKIWEIIKPNLDMHIKGFCFKIRFGKFQIIKPIFNSMHINGFSFKRARGWIQTMNLSN